MQLYLEVLVMLFPSHFEYQLELLGLSGLPLYVQLQQYPVLALLQLPLRPQLIFELLLLLGLAVPQHPLKLFQPQDDFFCCFNFSSYILLTLLHFVHEGSPSEFFSNASNMIKKANCTSMSPTLNPPTLAPIVIKSMYECTDFTPFNVTSHLFTYSDSFYFHIT